MNLETFYPLERPAGEMVRLTLADDAHVAALLAVGDPAAEVRLWRWSLPPWETDRAAPAAAPGD
jgi:hypothetical protein